MLNLRTIVISLSVLLLCAPVIAWSRFDYVNGGHGWRQGDWLINFGDGLVRRGFLGELLIFTSDISGVPLLITTLFVQLALFGAVAFVLWRIAIRYCEPSLLLLLAASPAFFLIFFAANPMGSMRKELFGVLALALLALCSLQRKQVAALPVLAMVAFTFGCIGNILHAFMLPAVLMALHLLRAQDVVTQRVFWLLSSTAMAMAVSWSGFALWYKEISSFNAICAPLQARGFDAEFCGHAIRWIVSGEVSHSGQVAQRLTLENLLEYVAVLPLCLASLALCFGLFAERRHLGVLIALCFLTLLPLYVIATDWGRWLSLSYTMTVLLLIQSHASGRMTLLRRPNGYLVAVLLGASLLIAPEHSIGLSPAGPLATIVETFLVFL